MHSNILTLAAQLITSYNHGLNQQVMSDTRLPPAYSHWLVLGPFQTGTRGRLGFLFGESIVCINLAQRHRGEQIPWKSMEVFRLFGMIPKPCSEVHSHLMER